MALARFIKEHNTCFYHQYLYFVVFSCYICAFLSDICALPLVRSPPCLYAEYVVVAVVVRNFFLPVQVFHVDF